MTMNAIRPSASVSIIASLPIGRRLIMRIYNRACMTFRPKRRRRTWFGADMDCDVRDMIQATIIHLGSWEPRLSAVLPALVRDGDVVADIGANIGYFSLLLSRAVGPEGRVVAIEALPRLARQIEHHVELNSIRNVTVKPVAASDRRGSVTIHEAGGTNIGMTTIMADRGFAPSGTVDCAPLHELLTERERDRLSLIKIDIEGAEPPVIRDFIAHLPRYPRRPALVVEISPNKEWASLFRQLVTGGYRAFDLHNDYDWLNLVDRPFVRPTEIAALPNQQTDMLFVAEPSQVEAILNL